jgi:hypothetical protein
MIKTQTQTQTRARAQVFNFFFNAQVVDFPAFIVCDDKGNDFFKEFNM